MTTLFSRPLAIVDIETTGLHPYYHRITEIAVVNLVDGEVTGEFSSLINPGQPIPMQIQRITGIDDALVANAPGFGEIAARLKREFLQDFLFVAHNAAFDYGFLRQEFGRVEIDFDLPSLCTVDLSRQIFPQYRRHNLDAIMERFSLQTDHRHRAMDDVRLLIKFLQIAETKMQDTSSHDVDLLERLIRVPRVVFE